MSMSDSVLPEPTRRIVRAARVVSLLALGVFIILMVALFFLALSGSDSADAMIVENFLKEETVALFTMAQRLFAAVLISLSSVTGLLGLLSAVQLFNGYLKGEIFTQAAARRVRFIGWMIVLIAPLSVAVNTLGHAIFTLWLKPGTLSISLGFDDGDILALAFGLLVVVIGHVMVRALDIAEENRSFV